jgi:hypothetical protein
MSADIFARCGLYDWTRARRAVGLYAYFTPFTDLDSTTAQVDGQDVIMCGSNPYLRLTAHERVRAATADYGSSRTGSRPLNGNTSPHGQLESEPADFFGTEAALVVRSAGLRRWGRSGARNRSSGGGSSWGRGCDLKRGSSQGLGRTADVDALEPAVRRPGLTLRRSSAARAVSRLAA